MPSAHSPDTRSLAAIGARQATRATPSFGESGHWGLLRIASIENCSHVAWPHPGLRAAESALRGELFACTDRTRGIVPFLRSTRPLHGEMSERSIAMIVKSTADTRREVHRRVKAGDAYSGEVAHPFRRKWPTRSGARGQGIGAKRRWRRDYAVAVWGGSLSGLLRRIDSPFSVMRWAWWTSRSRMASAKVASPTVWCQCSRGS